MYLLIFLLLLLVIFGYPLLKLYLTVRSARRRFNDMFGAYKGAGPTSGGGSGRRPRRRAKIITRDVGEYVEFEEIPGTRDTGSTPSATHIETSQVEDIEWEDL